jgi:oxalate decarboxylase/phosphoglucose isomerase-like protein (cupin superfamily)
MRITVSACYLSLLGARFFSLGAAEECFTNLDPMSDYVPFFNVSETSMSYTFVNDVTFNLAVSGAWTAMGDIGKDSNDNREGLSFAHVRASTKGSFRTPHYDANRGELVYVVQGQMGASFFDKSDMSAKTGKSSKSGKGDNSGPQLFLLEAGEAFFSPAGQMHYYENVGDKEDLIALSIYDASGVVSKDLPQIIKGFPSDVLSQVLKEPLKDVENWYNANKRVYIQHDDKHVDHSDKILSKGSSSDIPHITPKIDGHMKPAPRRGIHGKVRTGTLDVNSYPLLAQSKFSFAVTEIAPGARMEPYWVDNADELVFVLDGSDLRVWRSGKMSDCDDTFVMEENYLALHEETVTWYIENNGPKTARLFRIFNSIEPALTTLYDAYNALPKQVRKTMLA